MQRGTVVKMEVDEKGADLRVWVDDEAGHHLTVCEVRLTLVQVAGLVTGIDARQQQSDQYQLAFDD